MINDVIDILLISFFINLVINLCYKYLSDQTKIKAIKDHVKELKKKMKTASDDEKKEILNQIFLENSKIMKMNMKPLIISLFLVFLILGVLYSHYQSAVVSSPFPLPFIGRDLGWFWWYFISSIPIIILLRRVMGINV